MVGVMTINLDPDVTMNQFMDFMVNKFKPESDKIFPEWKSYFVKGFGEENENSFGVILIIESEDDRLKYFNEDGGFNELGNSKMEKLQPIIEESYKLGTSTIKYTGWVIQ